MGSREVLIVIASLILPALALGAIMIVMRAMKRDLTTLPKRILAPGITGFMMVGAVTSLIVLNGGGPATARAADDADAIEETEEQRAVSSLWIRVYPLENWGEENRRYRTGEEVTRIITTALRDHGLYLKKGVESDPPVGLYETSGEHPKNLIEHYRKIAPFISLTGFVSTLKDGRIEVTVTLSEIDATARSSTILEQKQSIPRSSSTISQMARQMADEIITILEEQGS